MSLPFRAVLALALVAACAPDPTAPDPASSARLAVAASAAAVAPSPASPLAPDIAIGDLETCAVLVDGTGECLGPIGVTPAPAPAPGSWFTQISAANRHSCALRSDGQVQCWPALPANVYGYAPALRTAPSGLRYTQVATGSSHSCALRDDARFECWGENSYLQLGWPPSQLAAIYTQVDAGETYTCAVRTDGKVECWGEIGFHAIGSGNHAIYAARTGSFTGVAAGARHVCALRSDGQAECWGGDNAHQEAPPVQAPTAGRFTQLAAGLAFTCALREDGRVQCWGDNSSGQAPALVVSPGAPYRKVVAGYQAACALREPHLADCWGRLVSRDLGAFQSLSAIGGTPPAALAAGSTFEVSATASSGLPVRFAIRDFDPSAPEPCTVSGTTVTAVSVGLCVVDAVQDGDAWWRRAARSRELGLAFLTLGRLAQVYDGTPRPVTLAVAPSFLRTVLTYDGQSSPPTAPGRYAVVAAVDPRDALYATSRAAGTLVVEMPRIAVQPARVSLSASTLVTVYVYGSEVVDAAAVMPVSVRLRVEGAEGGSRLAPVATRNGAYMTTVRDFDGDGRPDRQLVFLRSDLQAAGLTVGARTLVLSDHDGAYRFEARAPTPTDVVP